MIGLVGDLYPVSEAFVGPMTVDAASRLRVRTFFLGAAAVDDRGIYVASDIERPTKLALMDIADHVILLADSDSDCRPPDEVTGRLETAGTRLIVR